MSKRSGLLFIVFLVVAAIIVLVVLNRNAAPEPTNVTTTINQNVNTVVDEDTYQPVISADGAYTLAKPAQKLEVGEITTFTFDAGQLSVMPSAMQSLVLNETPVQAEVDVMVSGLPAKRYTLASAKDGSDFDVVQVLYLNQLYHFTGDEAFLSNLDQFITFNNNE
ncbi:MAG: hypothetical protein HY565_04890 [Candidatus Kerfeldbacteria bacterium]|nr:hypothetical protein [Candidatus Kerfeldbacteria bacterium]